MPCDSIITNTVEFSVAAKNPELLSRAVTAVFKTQMRKVLDAGYQFTVEGYTITVADGRAQVRGATQKWLGQQLDRLKQAYSREAVKEAARRAGFQIRRQGDNVNLMTAERRSA